MFEPPHVGCYIERGFFNGLLTYHYVFTDLSPTRGLLLLEDSKALARSSCFVLLPGTFRWSWITLFILVARTGRAEGYLFKGTRDSRVDFLWLVDGCICGQMCSRHLAKPLRDEDRGT